MTGNGLTKSEKTFWLDEAEAAEAEKNNQKAATATAA